MPVASAWLKYCDDAETKFAQLVTAARTAGRRYERHCVVGRQRRDIARGIIQRVVEADEGAEVGLEAE